MLTNATYWDVPTVRSVGKYEEFTARFVSTEVLTSDLINIDVGLFLQNEIDSGATAFVLTYPSTAGDYDMVFQGGLPQQNYEVVLTVVDALTFDITVKFMFRADTHKFISEGGANNAQSFAEMSFSNGDSVYHSLKFFAIRAQHEDDVALHYRSVGANFFDNVTTPLSYTLKSAGLNVQGYSLSADLDVHFTLEGSSFDAIYGVGLIRIDQISPGGTFIDAHSLNYISVEDSMQSAASIPADAFVSADQLVSTVPNYSDAQFTISKEHFVAGATYKFYIAAKQNGAHVSVISDEILQQPTQSEFPITAGSITCSTLRDDACYEVAWQTFVGPSSFSQLAAFIDLPSEAGNVISAVALSENLLGLTVIVSSSRIEWNYLGTVAEAGSFVTFEVTTSTGDMIVIVPLSTTVGQAQGTSTATCLTYEAFDTCCAEGVCPNSELTLCATMNQEEYDAAVITNGVTGSYEENLVSVTAGLTSDISQAPIQFDIPLSLDSSGCVTLDILEEWVNTTKYVVFLFHFDLGTHQDFIYRPFSIGIGDTFDLSVISIRDTDNNPVNVLCNEYDDILTVCLATASDCDNLDFLIGADGSFSKAAIQSVTINEDGACLEIDTSLLEDDKAYCIRVSCSADPIDPDDIVCDCFEITLTQTTVTAGDAQAAMSFAFVMPANVDQVEIFSDVGAAGIFTESGELLFNAPADSMILVEYTLVFTSGSCVYQTVITMSSCNIDADATIVTYNVCDDAPEVTCQNFAGILTSCDPLSQTITAVANTNESTNINTVTLEASQSGTPGSWVTYAGPYIGFAFYFFRLTVTFTDGCKTIIAHQHVECVPNSQLICLNAPEISECVFDADAQTLTLTDVGVYASTVSFPGFQYSIDGGVTWTDITGPIDTSSFVTGQVILVRLNPSYDDGCPQGPEAFRECIFEEDITSCDYSAFTLACAFDQNVFTATFSGDATNLEVDLREFSTDGGASWGSWIEIPISTGAQTALFRWTLKFTGCDTEVLISSCSQPCPCPTIEFPTDLNVNITNDNLTVSIDGCVAIQDCLDCTELPDQPDAGTAGIAEICEDEDV